MNAKLEITPAMLMLHVLMKTALTSVNVAQGIQEMGKNAQVTTILIYTILCLIYNEITMINYDLLPSSIKL